MMLTKAIIAGGGTGGHIYPGIAIAQEIKRRNPDAEVVFVGTARGLETRIVPAQGFKLELIDVAALKRVGLVRRVQSLLLLPRSFLAVRRLIQRFRPDVVIGVGGYASGPVVLVAALMGVPTLVAEQNALPGFTNRVLAKFVRAAALSFEEAQKFFGSKAEITGNPVREEFFEIKPRTRGSELHILITGGSQGARAINDAMLAALPLLESERERLSIVHQSGKADEKRLREGYANAGYRAEVSAFLDRMVEQFEKADLVISRAGATTVSELAAAGKASILVPFPFAADDHQTKNAEAVERAGAGRRIAQSELSGERLAGEILRLLREPHLIDEMSAASRKLAHRDAARRVVDIAERVSGVAQVGNV
jgi:UDP-N-acetylglucosamine--N-acetylmuramyl-(pentapeptide) pyrophosphoryl-undecaprenol N-acetylglucosamine transferase